MKKFKISVVLMSFVLVSLLTQLILPVLDGRSPVELGVDLSGGAIVTYRPDFSGRLAGFEDVSQEELLALAKETLSSRLSRSFSTIPEVVVRGDQTIVVTIPSRLDQKEVLELIGKTYHLTLRLVLQEQPGEATRDVATENVYRYQGRSLVLGAPSEAPGRIAGRIPGPQA